MIISIYILLVIISSALVLPIYRALQKELALLANYDLFRLTMLIVSIGFIAFPLYLIAAIFTYVICLFYYFKEGKQFSKTIKDIYEAED